MLVWNASLEANKIIECLLTFREITDKSRFLTEMRSDLIIDADGPSDDVCTLISTQGDRETS
jgi:hypothetical protein